MKTAIIGFFTAFGFAVFMTCVVIGFLLVITLLKSFIGLYKEKKLYDKINKTKTG